eukprot:scaffold278938_cov17-Prasinocladus_malaysianus.AAC.1
MSRHGIHNFQSRGTSLLRQLRSNVCLPFESRARQACWDGYGLRIMDDGFVICALGWQGSLRVEIASEDLNDTK